MAQTDQYPNLKVDSIEVVSELRCLDFNSDDFDIVSDDLNDVANFKVSTDLVGGIDDNAIAYAIALGGC